MRRQHVLISGASIAGPALAHWLVRHGFRVTVVERAAGPREGGSPIDVRGSAVGVADRMGIRPRLRRADIDTAGLAFVDANGTQLAGLDLRAVRSVTSGAAYELARADLVRILREATGDDVEYVFGESIVDLHQDDGGVEVRFRHGPPHRFDLVIGADGMHSGVCRLVFGDESRFLRYLGYYAAVVEVDPRLGRPHWGLMHNTPGTMVCTYSPPGRSDALFLFHRPQPVSAGRRDRQAQRRLVAEVFAGQGWQVPQLLEHLRDAEDFYFDAVSQVRLPRWSHGRTALVGDAAHGLPLFGDGSSSALIGAYLLAGELAAAGGDHRTAFARYERRHRPLVDAAQRGMGGATRLLIPSTTGGIWRRNQISRLTRLLPAFGWMRRWIEHDTWTLPEYPAGAAGIER